MVNQGCRLYILRITPPLLREMNFEDLGGKTKIWASKGSFIILMILLTPNFIYFAHH